MDIEETRNAYNRAMNAQLVHQLQQDARIKRLLDKPERTLEEQVVLYKCNCLFIGSKPKIMCRNHVEAMWQENQQLRQQIKELTNNE